MKTSIDTLIFDLDGVLIDSGRDIAKAVNATLVKYHRPSLAYEEIISYVGDGAKNLIKRAFKDADDALMTAALSFYKDYYLAHCTEETFLYPAVKEVLEKLSHKNMGILTNKPEKSTQRLLRALDISQYFGIILSPESVTHIKPHPEGILKILDFYGKDAATAMMIGDAATDIEAGRAAGTLTCGITYGLGAKDDLMNAHPNFLIHSFSNLLKIVL